MKSNPNIMNWFKAIAPILIVALLTVIFFNYNGNKIITISTGYGQSKLITLPDQTTVKLNANSKLSFQKKWDKHKIYEVWLKGEAFFNVKHLRKSGQVKLNENFIVHSNKINIEGLETSFNVSDRRGKVKVLLITGHIKLNLNVAHAKPVYMLPGELAEFKQQSNFIQKKLDNNQVITYWKNKGLQFENVNVKVLFDFIEDTYGNHIVIKDKWILNKRISGDVSFSDEATLLKIISITLNTSIEKTNNKELIFTRS